MNIHSVHLRLGGIQEYETLAALDDISGAQFPPGRVPVGGPPYDRAAFERSVAARLTWFAEVENETIGYATSEIIARHLHLLGFGVHPGHTREGIGTVLLDRVKQDARDRDLPGVTLTTFADVSFNGPYYAKRGFREIPPAELSPELTQILNAEAAAGLTHRIAMQFRF